MIEIIKVFYFTSLTKYSVLEQIVVGLWKKGSVE